MKKLLPLSCLTASSLSAIDIQIDYSFDSNNFFNTAERRTAIEAVADFYGNILQDNLLRIDSSEFSNSTWVPLLTNPTTGELTTLDDIVIPEDTIIIYVGSRQFNGNTSGTGGPNGFASGTSGTTAWIDRLLGRGQAGAEARDRANRTDIGIWGGSISFDSDSIWNFSLQENNPGIEFIRVALHEIAHVLGIGSSAPWDNLVIDQTFTGPITTFANGSPPSADTAHFTGTLNSPLYGSFGTTHGEQRPALMLPISTDTGNNFDVITDIDLAALADLGWEVILPLEWNILSLIPQDVRFSWPSNSIFDYQVIRTSDLQTQTGGSPLLNGNGLILNWTDPSPPSPSAFYQLAASFKTPAPNNLLAPDPLKTPPATSASKLQTKQKEQMESIEIIPQLVTNCTCEHQD